MADNKAKMNLVGINNDSGWYIYNLHEIQVKGVNQIKLIFLSTLLAGIFKCLEEMGSYISYEQ